MEEVGGVGNRADICTLVADTNIPVLCGLGGVVGK
jgi:hypothetical protein